MCVIKEVYHTYLKSEKNYNLCLDKFWDNSFFWRGTRGMRGKHML